LPELIVDLERVGVDAIAAGEGKNLKFERRSADRGDRLRSLAAELVRLKVDLILANGTRAARAAKEATKAIPIVFSLREDPVTNGLVASFARPGGNLTGFDDGADDQHPRI
jgi:putative ABC transport system substrate-binding protein